ncbi:hypothetical protein E2I00_002782, partial [Balaenoptera physalus]
AHLQNLQSIMELLYWLLEEGDSEDREFIKKPKILCLTKFSYQSEISCGLFSLDAKAMEKSSAQITVFFHLKSTVVMQKKVMPF